MSKIITGMEGKMYGKWLVLKEDAGRSPSGAKLCLCECQCELKTQRLVIGYNLRAGRSTSCGCEQRKKVAQLNYKEETGKKYNNLLVLYRTNQKGASGQ